MRCGHCPVSTARATMLGMCLTFIALQNNTSIHIIIQLSKDNYYTDEQIHYYADKQTHYYTNEQTHYYTDEQNTLLYRLIYKSLCVVVSTVKCVVHHWKCITIAAWLDPTAVCSQVPQPQLPQLLVEPDHTVCGISAVWKLLGVWD